MNRPTAPSVLSAFPLLALVFGCAGGGGERAAPRDVGSDTGICEVCDDVYADGRADGFAADSGPPDAAADAPADTSPADADASAGGWIVPGGPWPGCPEPAPGPSLADKAAYYDWIVPRVHLTPLAADRDWSILREVTLAGPAPTAIVPDDELPAVVHRHDSDNQGLWTSPYVASQAFRHAATGDPEALANLRRSLRGMVTMMRVTGVPGLLSRDLKDPRVDGLACPDDPMEYRPPDAQRRGNRMVRVDETGCNTWYDWDEATQTGAWVRSDVCPGAEYAGYCWKRNVSRDEIAGHMFVYGVVGLVVSDPEARALAAEAAGAVGRHLVTNDLWMVDVDGRETEHASSFATSLDHFPGFQAMHALSWLRVAASLSGDEALADYYRGCLLQGNGREPCVGRGVEAQNPVDYLAALAGLPLSLGCDVNYDNVSMMFLAYAGLVWHEPHPELRAAYRAAFHAATRGPAQDFWAEGNPLYDFLLAATMEGTDPEAARALVADGLCTLHRFPADQLQRARDTTHYETACADRAAAPIPIDERCASIYAWWWNPRSRQTCGDDPTTVRSPGDYLLTYWMGRYFGFVAPTD